MPASRGQQKMAESRQIETNQFLSIYVTCPDRDCARTIATHLLEARLIACANIFDGAQSLYHWQGEIAEDSETILIMKAPATSFDAIEAEVTARHPYDVPCILGWPIVEGHAPYLEWLAEQTN